MTDHASTNSLRSEVYQLAAAHLAGELTDEEASRLHDLVCQNPDACRHYVRFMSDALELSALAGRHFQEDVKDSMPAQDSAPLAARERSQQHITEPVRGARQPGRADRFERTRSWPSRLARQFHWTRHPEKFTAAVLVILLCCLSLFFALITPHWQHPQPVANDPDAEQDIVARLVWVDRARWSGEPPTDLDIQAGHRLKLESGMAELRYKTGAIVILQGPAEFWVGGHRARGTEQGAGGSRSSLKSEIGVPVKAGHLKSKNSGYLALGKLVARVEGKNAKGFTVEFPHARVEDLGTEFAVDLKRDGTAEVVVLAGAVDLIGQQAGGRAGSRIRLTKDQGAFVEAGGGTITRRGQVDVRFASAMRSRLRQKDVARPIVSDVDPGLLVGRFQSGSPRLNDPRYKIVDAPASLVGLTSIVAPRGAGIAHPGAGFRFRVDEPVRLYLLVHNRGDHALEGWRRTEDSVTWTTHGQTHTDTVYTRLVEPGEVDIPAHTWRNKEFQYGVPHVCLVAPPAPAAGEPSAETKNKSD